MLHQQNIYLQNFALVKHFVLERCSVDTSSFEKRFLFQKKLQKRQLLFPLKKKQKAQKQYEKDR